MTKIERLTKDQERALKEYCEQWMAIGCSTEPADRPTFERAVTMFYTKLGKKTPFFWWNDGPATGSIIRTLLRGGNLRDNLGNNLWVNSGDSLDLGDNLRANLRVGNDLKDDLWNNLGSLRASLGDNLGDALRADLGNNLWANLWDNLRDNLRDILRDILRDGLLNDLGANLWDSLGADLRVNLSGDLRDNLKDNLRWWFWGAHEAAWIAYYLWPHTAIRPMHSEAQMELLNAWVAISKSAGWWQPYEGICFVCERPQIQAVDKNGRLHRDGGPALLCRDGWPVYALHGIRMKREYVETSAENITPETVLSETNADIRRELLRKVGIERMLSRLSHRSIHKRGTYEVLSVRLSEQVTDARYLRMENPSVGCWHLEGIPPECDTVEKALSWRNHSWHENAEILT